MKYFLALIPDPSTEPSPDSMKAWDAFTSEATETGAFVGGEGLQGPETATTIRLQESGEPIVSDGPFAETKEQLGGYYLLDCKDLDEALDWAKKIPMPGGTVEVRPVMDYEAAGSQAHHNEAEAAR
ncbi:MAG TPA: YciI family protein [Thermoleophilaceae bacterium]|jgi:hypothetical protein